jgi:hypothetical protein
MLLANTVRRSEDFTRECVLARTEFRLREHLVRFFHRRQLARKPLAPVMLMPSGAITPAQLPRANRIFSFEPAS